MLRFLGPSARVAGLLAVLWAAACTLHAFVLIQAIRTIAVTSSAAANHEVDPLANAFTSTRKDLAALAAVQLFLSTIILLVVLTVLGMDCRYDPD
jgi:hypothetical protein